MLSYIYIYVSFHSLTKLLIEQLSMIIYCKFTIIATITYFEGAFALIDLLSTH